MRKLQKVELKIPSDIRDGMKLRLKGLGEPGEGGGDNGDLHLLVRLEDDNSFHMVNGELEAQLSITPWEAHAGAKLDVRTARGVVTISIPPNSRSGKRLRLKGQGFANKKGEHGDCYVRLAIDLPLQLTKRQNELLNELAEAGRSVGAKSDKGGSA